MSRMDVKKKLELSFVFDSYWDMLPREIQDYIVHLKIAQQKIDSRFNEKMEQLCADMMIYGKIKAKWGLGLVKCDRDNKECDICYRVHLFGVYGMYLDDYNVKQKIFLGLNFQQALQRVNHVKSFL